MDRKLTILHCLRAPLGGLFRHVCDLVDAQTAQGHDVGIICDSNSFGPSADERLSELKKRLPLGVSRIAMNRNVGIADFSAVKAVKSLAERLGAKILHGHGAKGGAYSRLAARSLRQTTGLRSFYTPHGGSLHYDARSLKGRLYLELERRMAPMTDGLIFESAYSGEMFEQKIGTLETPFEIIPNGLLDDEFTEHATQDGAADIIFIGELRHLKGVDIFLRALHEISATRTVSGHIYGDGPDEERFKTQARELGLLGIVDFPGRVNAYEAFSTGRLLVVPSRAESFPYIVLEAGAAAIPLVTTNVGGIPEIVGPHTEIMIEPGNVSALRKQIEMFLDDPEPFHASAARLRMRIRDKFTVDDMAGKITDFYFSRLNS